MIGSRTWGNDRQVARPDPRPLEILLAAGGRPRLHEAVWLDDVDLARLRLDEGADVDINRWTYLGTVIQVAAGLGYLGTDAASDSARYRESNVGRIGMMIRPGPGREP